MTRRTSVVCDGCGRTMLGEAISGAGAMVVRDIAAAGADPDWHYLPGTADGIGRDVCPQCWAAGVR